MFFVSSLFSFRVVVVVVVVISFFSFFFYSSTYVYYLFIFIIVKNLWWKQCACGERSCDVTRSVRKSAARACFRTCVLYSWCRYTLLDVPTDGTDERIANGVRGRGSGYKAHLASQCVNLEPKKVQRNNITMDSEEETPYDDVDSGNESSGDDVDFAMDIESGNPRERAADIDDYPFGVLSTEEIVQHMVDSIKEVNTVVEVSL